MDIPKKLYHATTWQNAISISESALKPLGIDKLIYFADSFAGAGVFAFVHNVPIEDIIVIEVDTSKLNKDLFDYGLDHNPVFFKNITVYTYPEEIPSEYCDYYKIDREAIKKGIIEA